MPSRSRRHKPRQSTSRWWLAVLAVVALAASGTVALALSRGSESTAVERVTVEEDLARYTESEPEPTPASVKKQLADASVLLSDPKRPFTIAVMGDSTGADRNAWVNLTGDAIAERYNRTFVVHPWQEGDVKNYVAPIVRQTGTAGTLTIYNGSAAGTDTGYALEQIDQMIPGVTPDIVIINHGHNVGSGTIVIQTDALLKGLTERYPEAAIANIVQNPEKPGSLGVDRQTKEVSDLKQFMSRRGHQNIDVRSAFLANADYSTLLKDNVHPNDAGYAIWRDVVLEALNLP